MAIAIITMVFASFASPVALNRILTYVPVALLGMEQSSWYLTLGLLSLLEQTITFDPGFGLLLCFWVHSLCPSASSGIFSLAPGCLPEPRESSPNWSSSIVSVFASRQRSLARTMARLVKPQRPSTHPRLGPSKDPTRTTEMMLNLLLRNRLLLLKGKGKQPILYLLQ